MRPTAVGGAAEGCQATQQAETNGEAVTELWNSIATKPLEALGVLIAALVALGGFIAWVKSRRTAAPLLEVASVRHELPTQATTSPSTPRYPAVLIALVNRGRETAVTNEVVCEITKRWSLRTGDPQMYLLTPTQQDLVIRREGPFPQRIVHAISLALEPQKADQLQLNLTALPLQPIEEIYHLVITVRYDNVRVTDPVALLVVLPEVTGPHPPYFRLELEADFARRRRTASPGGELEKVLDVLTSAVPTIDAHNQAVLKELEGYDPSVFTPRVQVLLDRAKASPPL